MCVSVLAIATHRVTYQHSRTQQTGREGQTCFPSTPTAAWSLRPRENMMFTLGDMCMCYSSGGHSVNSNKNVYMLRMPVSMHKLY